MVAASTGTAPAPQMLLRALAGGAVPVASRLPQYEEVLEEGELGLLFEPRDVLTLGAQLERLVSEPELVQSYAEKVAAVHDRLSWGARGRRAGGPLPHASPRAATRRTATPRSAAGSPTATSSTWTSTCTPTTPATAPRR